MSTNNNNNTFELEDADKYTMVHANIRQANKINGISFKAIDKLIYCYLMGWKRSAENPDSKVKEVRPTFRQIQVEHGVSKGTVESTMKNLEQMGLIVVTRKIGGVNIYDVVEFDQVVATHLEIKKDDFILGREANRAEQPKAEPTKQIVQEPQQADTETNWYKFKDELIKSEPRWDQLTRAQQMTISNKISSMLSSNPKAVSEVFGTEIAKIFYKPKQEQTKAPEQKSSNYLFIANLPSTAQSIEPEYSGDTDIPF